MIRYLNEHAYTVHDAMRTDHSVLYCIVFCVRCGFNSSTVCSELY